MHKLMTELWEDSST